MRDGREPDGAPRAGSQPLAVGEPTSGVLAGGRGARWEPPPSPAQEAPDRGAGDAHRLEARQLYRACPPFRIHWAADGAAVLSVKHYAYVEELPPEDATRWRELSRHADLEEAERRLRLICSTPVHYDGEGRVARAPRGAGRPLWNMPPEDDGELEGR